MLIDEIKSRGLYIPEKPVCRRYRDSVLALLDHKELVCIDGQASHDYVLAVNGPYLNPEDIRKLCYDVRPPSTLTFIERRATRDPTYEEAKPGIRQSKVHRAGALFVWSESLQNHRDVFNDLLSQSYVNQTPKGESILLGIPVIESTDKADGVMLGLAIGAYWLDKDGYIQEEDGFASLESTEIGDEASSIGLNQGEVDLRDLYGGFFTSGIGPVLPALSMMNFKNITRRLVDRNTDAPKLAKKRQKRGVAPFVKYYTLDVISGRELTEVLNGSRSEGDVAGKPLHQVRGHTRDCRKSGLFGKYHGIFYIKQHERGDINQGLVHKRYRVKTKPEKETS